MFDLDRSFLALLSGSNTCFKQRDGFDSMLGEIQKERNFSIAYGVEQLRRFRTVISKSSSEEQGEILEQAAAFADQLADFCLADCIDRGAPLEHHPYLSALTLCEEKFKDVEAESAHSIPGRIVCKNLRRATEDIVTRLEETVSSAYNPSRKLNLEEAKYVLSQFLNGTNCLQCKAQESFFSSSSVVGGLLSVGLVYALVAKKVMERYGEESISQINVVPVAVSVGKNVAKFGSVGQEEQVKEVVLVDDMIDSGRSLRCAMTAAEDIFRSADIFSGICTSYSEGRESPSQIAHSRHLSRLFHKFADFVEDNNLGQARTILIDAVSYSRQHGSPLAGGWYGVSKRAFSDAEQILGPRPSL